MIKIYHIFPVRATHLVLDISESLIKYFNDNEMSIILIGDSSDSYKYYVELFSNFSFNNYHICKNIYEFIRLNVDKKFPIIVHSDRIQWLAILSIYNFKNINWVNWGSGLRLNRNFKSFIIYPFKLLIYKNLKNIVVLSSQDMVDIKKYFYIKKVFLISYISKLNDSDEFEYNIIDFKDKKREYINVLFGNNVTCILFYIQYLDVLTKIKNQIKIQCMLNYFLDNNNNEYKQLILKGEKLYGDNFSVNTDTYNLNDYIDYINKFDVYVCDVKRQTGLGAIYTCLRIGKKIYLSGNNFNFISSLGCKIFHCDELKINPETILIPLCKNDIELNRKIIFEYLDSKNLIFKWNQFFDEILNK